MLYKATLQRQYRDAYTGQPKVLLTNVFDAEGKLFRDHCWSKETPQVNKLLKKYQKCEIHFIANEVIYLKRGKEPSTTIQIVEIVRVK